MFLILDDVTAYEYWMLYNPLYSNFPDDSPRQPVTTFEHSSSNEISKMIAMKDGETGPIHIMVDSLSNRRPSENVICHVFMPRTPLPPKSIYHIGPNLGVVSPELCMVRLAASLPRYELLHKVSNMLGLFSFNYWDRMELVEREAITSIQKTREYLKEIPYAKGVRNLRQALNSVCERCRSPRETTLALNLKMSTRLGGQSLPPFEVNSDLDMSDEAKLLTKKSNLEGDIVWKKKNAVIEYNSDEWHLNTAQTISDMEKISAMQRMGVTVFPMSTRQFDDYDVFESFICGVRTVLGVRDRNADAARAKRRALHTDLIEVERVEREKPVLGETARWQYLEPRLDVANL